MYWFIGILAIFIIAYVIIKLSINTKKNPDSNLGILDHPSTYKKQDIEMVDESLTTLGKSRPIEDDTTNWNNK